MRPALDRHLREEGNRALQQGAAVAFALGVVNALLLPMAMVAGLTRGLWGPWAFTLVCCAACAVLWRMARQRKVHGWAGWAVMLSFTMLPTGFLLSCELWAPSGAATFVNGPLSMLYFILIATTACAFDPKLSVTAGLVSAAGYGLAVWVGFDDLQQIQAADPLIRQDFVKGTVYGFKCLMIAFSGGLVGALAVVGRRLATSVLDEAEQKQAVHRLLGTYVSEEVADRLVGGVEVGQRVEAVVLFCDLRGFTAYSEQADPEALVARLNAYLEAMVHAIRAHGGVVDKFVGDEVMAVFGGLVPIDQPEAAAVRAALEMSDRLLLLNIRWAEEGLPAFSHGVGIHRGEVVQGAIGSPERRDFTVIGDTVNTASRIEGLTRSEGKGLLISEAVHQRLPSELAQRFDAIGSRAVKGRTTEIALFASARSSRART